MFGVWEVHTEKNLPDQGIRSAPRPIVEKRVRF